MPLQAYSAMDKEIDNHAYARMFLLFLGFSKTLKDRGKYGDWMSDSWQVYFKSWLVQMVKHLKNKGLAMIDFAVYPYDEYIGDDFYKVARVIRETDPRIKIFANSYGNGPRDFNRLKDLVDIWCVHQGVSVRQPDWLKTVQSFGKEMWTYKASGPVRSQKPF